MNAVGIIRIIPTKATNLLPPKNDIAEGSSTSLKRLYAQDISSPTTIPPNTDVFID